jgi:hypothetical protein
MKILAGVIVFILSICLIPTPGVAAPTTVYESAGTIIGTQAFDFEFDADIPRPTYRATLTDLSESPLEFGFLGLFISTSTQNVGSITAPGTFNFPVTPGTTYFGGVVGKAAGVHDAGRFGVKIEAVPIPQTIMLLAAGVMTLVFIRRRKQ